MIRNQRTFARTYLIHISLNRKNTKLNSISFMKIIKDVVVTEKSYLLLFFDSIGFDQNDLESVFSLISS